MTSRVTNTSPSEKSGDGLYDRYPGPRSFIDNDVDRHLFFGREQEIDHLVHRVRAVRLLIVFGKSGLGKTSLLQAGLYSLLRERGLLPVPVRLNQPGVEPVRAVLDALRTECGARGVEYASSETEGLWEFFKATDLWRGDVLQTPVLVFDQFEELFTLQSESVRQAVAVQLGELTVRGLPTRMRERTQAGEQIRYTDAPPDVKVILSLREEYVGALEDLVPNVPALFEQRFRLAPLTTADARRAVVEPAALDKPHLFATRPFRYEKATLDAMMDFLANRQREVEPFQLQIICQYVEQQVAQRQRLGQGEVEVDQSVLGGRTVMEGLLQDFYRRAVRQLPSWPLSRQRGRARRLCERGLLSPTGHRVSMQEGQIRKQYKMSEPSLERLTEARLLRKETRPGLEGFYYELSHDSLIGPVMKRRRVRERGIKIALLAVSVLFVGMGLWSVRESKQAEQERQVAESSMEAYKQTILTVLEKGGLLEPVMVDLPAGRFRMGNVQAEKTTGKTAYTDELPVRWVTIARAFKMGRYEITFEEYDQFAAETGRSLPGDSGWGRGKRPVINVSWQDAKEYAKWLSAKASKRYRLPTEAEWEYAARAGTATLYWWGDEIGKNQANCDGCRSEWDNKQTAPVGSFQPNKFGLYDTAGNVWEWVEDCWHENYEGAPGDGSAWLEAKRGDCGKRVLRGGSWFNVPVDLRVSNRRWNFAGYRYGYIGFRLAQDLEP